METKTIICADCKKEFIINIRHNNPKFKRKFCDNCKAKREKAYNEIYKLNPEDCE